MKRFIASLLCVLLVAPGCATGGTTRAQTTPRALSNTADRDVLSDFARQLPIGSRVRVTLAGNHVLRGTLLKRTDQSLVIQPRARVAEPLIEVPFANLVALEQEVPSNGTGRAVAIGVGVGVGAALGCSVGGVAGRLNSRQSSVVGRQSQSSVRVVSRRFQSPVFSRRSSVTVVSPSRQSSVPVASLQSSVVSPSRQFQSPVSWLRLTTGTNDWD